MYLPNVGEYRHLALFDGLNTTVTLQECMKAAIRNLFI